MALQLFASRMAESREQLRAQVGCVHTPACQYGGQPCAEPESRTLVPFALLHASSPQVSELLPALDGPGGALCGYVEAHAFIASVKAGGEAAAAAAARAEAERGAAAGEEAAALEELGRHAARLPPLRAEVERLRAAALSAANECGYWTQQHLEALAIIR